MMEVSARAFRSIATGPVILGSVTCLVAWMVFAVHGADVTRLHSQALANADWERRAPLVACAFLMPTLVVTLSLRSSWPLLGPGDSGRRMIPLHAVRPARTRFAACLGVLAALLCLQGLVGAVVGCSLGIVGFERLALDRELDVRGARYLVHRGDRVAFDLPRTSAVARLRFEPRSGFGSASLALPSDYVLISPSGDRRAFSLRAAGATAVVAIGSHTAGTWSVERRGGDGTGSDFRGGRTHLEDGSVSPTASGFVLAFDELSRACVLTAAALALARFVGPFLHIAVLVTVFFVTFVGNGIGLPGIVSDAVSASDALARGAIPRPRLDGQVWTAAALVALLVTISCCKPTKGSELC
ncbi:MAG: hypothetical protein H6834_01125 [Planctomycetes bacterium]|nr:hypothetical protein [Planctomycetota bacterium]